VVDLLGVAVRLLDIEAQPDDIALLDGRLPNRVDEGAKDPLAAPRRFDKHALQPPHPTVAPVAPFAGNGRLANGFVTVLDHPVTKPVGLGQGTFDAACEHGRVEPFPLRLLGQSRIEANDRGQVG
jgi:hypothetical protein